MKKYILIGLIAVLVCFLAIFSLKAIGFDEPVSLDSPQRVITITAADGTVITIPLGGEGDVYGGTIYNRLIEFSEGISVDGTTVIDGSGNWDGAVTGTTGTFSSTLGVTGAVTLNSTLDVNANTTLATTTLDSGTTLTSSGPGIFSTTLAVTGATTLSSTLAVTGATTLATTTLSTSDTLTAPILNVNDTTDSTIHIGGTGTLTGCIKIGDSGGSSTKYYAEVVDGFWVITSTSTPANCR